MRVCRTCIKDRKKARRSLEDQYHSWVESSRAGDLYSSFCWSFFWKQTGRIETTAKTPKTMREFQDTASPAVVSLYSVVPAFIATNDGGATPVDQTTSIRGFICQLCNISVNSLLIFGYFRLKFCFTLPECCENLWHLWHWLYFHFLHSHTCDLCIV